MGNFLDETRGMLERVAAGSIPAAHQRIAQVKLVASASDGNVHETAFLLLAIWSFQRAVGRKHPVTKHNHKHHVKFEAFGLVNRGKPELLVVVITRLIFFGLQVGQEGKLGQKILHRGELIGKNAKLLQVLESGAIIVIALFEVIFVAGFDDQADHLGRISTNVLGIQLGDCRHELGPGDSGLPGNSFLASLKSVPEELYEAALIDGATWSQRMRYVTLPLMRNVIAIMMMFSLIGGFTGFTIVDLLTHGGPLGTTGVLATSAFFLSIMAGNFPLGAAVSLFMLPVLALAATVILRGIARRGSEV